MGIEIEKKYRLNSRERERLLARLLETGAERESVEFEENTIYAGGRLEPGRSALRVRRVEGATILTYKERFPSRSSIKRQREEETRVENAEALAAILESLGYSPALVYEKRRETWRVAGAVVVVDELPFGLFAEIEGEEKAIMEAERLLELEDAEAELSTYPQLTEQYGERKGTAIEARFS
jgi:adenylate cyclase class 2